MDLELTRFLHCQHAAGDAAEPVGWDLGDVGMVNNFPAQQTQIKLNDVVNKYQFIRGGEQHSNSSL